MVCERPYGESAIWSLSAETSCSTLRHVLNVNKILFTGAWLSGLWSNEQACKLREKFRLCLAVFIYSADMTRALSAHIHLRIFWPLVHTEIAIKVTKMEGFLKIPSNCRFPQHSLQNVRWCRIKNVSTQVGGEEDFVIQLKIAEQPLNGTWGEIVFATLVEHWWKSLLPQ